MATIKISKLLPVKSPEVDASFYGILDNGRDTYKISLADMKVLFSSDTKVDALRKDINAKIEELNNRIKQDHESMNRQIGQIDTVVAMSKKTVEQHTREIEILTKWKIEQSKAFSEVQNTVNMHTNALRSFDNYIISNNERYSNMLINVNAIGNDVRALQKTTGSMSNSINNITETLKNMQITIDNNKSESEVLLSSAEKRLIRLIQEKYNELLAIIDHYHHDSSFHPDILATFTFDNEETGFSSANAKADGTYTLVNHNEGKALSLDGNGQFLQVTAEDGTSLLTNVEELTISFQMKPNENVSNWAFYAAPSADAQVDMNECYIGIFDNNGTISVERYNNEGSRPDPLTYTISNTDDWIHVTLVLTKTESILYIDGVEVASATSEYQITDILGKNSIIYIGSAWNTSEDGEYYNGLIDNYKIYSRALSTDEIVEEFEKYKINSYELPYTDNAGADKAKVII